MLNITRSRESAVAMIAVVLLVRADASVDGNLHHCIPLVEHRVYEVGFADQRDELRTEHSSGSRRGVLFCRTGTKPFAFGGP
jgi:hypothetical protein